MCVMVIGLKDPICGDDNGGGCAGNGDDNGGGGCAGDVDSNCGVDGSGGAGGGGRRAMSKADETTEEG